jgi:hypothetical protein
MMGETSCMTTQDTVDKIFCVQVMYPVPETEQDPLMAYKASAYPDTMYMHQAVK